MMIVFLGFGGNNSTDACQAQPATVQRVGQQNFQVLHFTCGPKHFRVWQYWCAEGQGYWSRPFLLEETNVHRSGFYLNRFGEVHATPFTDPITTSDLYLPRCGS